MRHECCQGRGDCKARSKEDRQDIKLRVVGDKVLVECHHGEITCPNQYEWYSHSKYCNCPVHELLQRRKEGTT